ncbi:MAG: YicC/YloC family endoribonuclease, partial [Thermodesulfobacteriota bacterium]
GNVALFIKQTSSAERTLKINTSYVEASMEAADKINDLGVKGELDICYLLSQRETFLEVDSEVDVEADWAELKKGLGEALSSVVEWREKEGAKLKSDLIEKIEIIDGFVGSVAKRVPELSTEYREKLTKRIKELIEKEVDESRLLTEAAVVAERSSIDEEIVRLKSHLERFADLLGDAKPVGRKLDFLCQEILREVNTIGSKVSDVGVTETVVDMKAELEKVREQVQNIE